MVLVVEVTSPLNAWSDRFVKPDAYARTGIPHYLRVDLDRGVGQLLATLYSLNPGRAYEEQCTDENGRLVLNHPFSADLDLVTLTTASRYPHR